MLQSLGVGDPLAQDSPDLFEQAAAFRAQSGLNGSGQTVAVIDSGVAWDHVALGGGFGPGYRVVGGWDFAEQDANPYDDGPAGFHGTHVAGVLAGDYGPFSGIAPAADIVALRVFDDEGVGKLQWIESALQWVYEHRNAFESPITTVNLSVGAALTPDRLGEATSMLEDELQLLRNEGILVFAASGNLQQSGPSSESVLYPASSASVVAVASHDPSGSLSDFAQRENGIFAARGEAVRSSVPDHVYGWDGNVNDFATLNGTSMASPQIAAASMLVRQALLEQGLTPTADEVLARLRDTSTEHFDAETGQTFRILNLHAATNVSGAVDGSASLDGRFVGIAENESVTLDLTQGAVLRVGSQQFDLLKPDADSPFVIDGGLGSDSLVILGSDQAERLIARPVASGLSSQLTTAWGEFELLGFEQIEFQGGGGSDRATLYDGHGNDTLNSGPGTAIFTGVGFRFEVSNVPRVFVHATAGGDDSAFMRDSAGDDALSVRPQFTSLRGQGTFQLAYGFERVFAYAEAGGTDTAELYDSPGDDTMSISPGRAIISSAGYQVSTRGFQSVIGIASDSGNDIARIYADSASNQWHSTPDMVQWTGATGHVRIARGFERVEAFENFQPIELSQQSIPSWLLQDREKLQQEASVAVRSVFEWLGQQP